MKLLIFCLFLFFSIVCGQFGVLNKNDGSKLEDNLQEASIGVDGSIDEKYESLAKKLQSAAPISAEDAVHLAILLEEAKVDAETAVLLSEMPKEALEKLKATSTPMEIVHGMKANLDELKAVEILFSNPERAVVEMEKEGLIDKKRVDFYKKNPSVLKDDTNKFSPFLSITTDNWNLITTFRTFGFHVMCQDFWSTYHVRTFGVHIMWKDFWSPYHESGLLELIL